MACLTGPPNDDCPMTAARASRTIVPGTAQGPVIVTEEGLSFWGGIDPASGRVIDIHHPLHGTSLAGAVVLMPTSRGSCTGSGVLLDLILNGHAPAGLVFREAEDVATLGAVIAAEMFGRTIPVVRLSPRDYAAVANEKHLAIEPDAITTATRRLALAAPAGETLHLSPSDRAMLAGEAGPATRQAMRIIVTMAGQQGAERLCDVTRAHIDGCIYASPANLTFAEKMAELGGRVRIPTTMNAISVDHENWRAQGTPTSFGLPAQRLADAYVRMGCTPTFTCAPYLLEAPPTPDEAVAWAESNAVAFANSVLGARTAKHPDFLDLCIALTGRAPEAGVYLAAERRARRVIDVETPGDIDDAFWPLLGYLAGEIAPDRIPLLRGLAATHPTQDDLKALCAAFATTSAAPMLHVEGVTPEAGEGPAPGADHAAITRADLRGAWQHLNAGPGAIDLVAIGSPHASLDECRAFARALAGRKCRIGTTVIVTTARHIIAAAEREGTLQALRGAGVMVVPDLCWCSITEPLFPPSARVVLTTSGKYAHYGPGLSGRTVRLASLAACAEAAVSGLSAPYTPPWLI